MMPTPTKKKIAQRRAISFQAAKESFGASSQFRRTDQPTLYDFDLPDDFELADFEVRENQRLEKAEAFKKNTAIAVTFFAAFPAFMAGFDTLGTLMLAAFYAVPIFFAVRWLFAVVPVNAILQWAAGDLVYAGRVAKFRVAHSKWEYFNLTTGVGFWQSLRGQALEHAAARMFREQGWSVCTTAVTGDGGVDLVLQNQTVKIWCQCKGYAKPVSVPAVREIAGVCSTENAVPMLMVVNGLTGPAMTEAEKLSVIVWDSRELAGFARGDLTLQ